MIPDNTLNTNGLPVFVWTPSYDYGSVPIDPGLVPPGSGSAWTPGTTSPGVAKLILMALLGGF